LPWSALTLLKVKIAMSKATSNLCFILKKYN